MGLCGAHVLDRNGRSGNFGAQFEKWAPRGALDSWFLPPFLGVEEYTKIIKNTQWLDQKSMLIKACVFTYLLLVQGKVHIAFFQNGHPHFWTVFSTTCGTLEKILSPGAQLRIFGELNGPRGLCLCCCLCLSRVPWSVKCRLK